MASAQRRGTRAKIKPPKKHGPEVSVDQTWLALSKNIREIQNQKASQLSFEENHRFAYNMVLFKNGKLLYDGTKELVAEHLDRLAETEIKPSFPTGAVGDRTQQGQQCEILLKSLKHVWDDHSSSMTKLGQILKYMDRVYTKSADVPETREAGLMLFLKHIIRPPIQDHLVSAVLGQIRMERDGYAINRSAVKECVDVFLTLKNGEGGPTIYKRDLEPAVLSDTKAFYEAEGKRLVETCDAPEFLKRVEERFEQEKSRANHYLSSQTLPALNKILEDDLLTAHLVAIISMPNSGLDAMIDSEKDDDLGRLYTLYLKVPAGLPTLKRALKDSLARRGKEVNQNSLANDAGGNEVPEEDNEAKGKGKARPANSGSQILNAALKWVQDVLDLKDKFDHVWKASFKSDRELESALNEAFETFVNLNDKSPEFISLFIDENLKKGLKGKTDQEVDTILDKTITVFRYITEKDVFERYYKGHLAKRLLHGRSVSDDAERGMLAKLKIECGYQFTQKLEGMFNDMKLSVDAMNAYRKQLSTTEDLDIELSVIVMTSTFWPMAQTGPACALPEELLKTLKSFERFYLKRHTGRRLTWQLSMGNADVRVAFKSKKHDLNVSTLALVVLLLFEDHSESDFLTFKEIQSATSMDDAELRRQLQSLACAKFKILKKHPPGREVADSDSFSFNHEFSAPAQRIKISTIVSKVENNEERKETRDRVDEERRHQIEACIVRIMKDRKTMTHNDLINEATKQLASRFLPDPNIIKKRIEQLIEREYLERRPDRKSYNYLA